MALPKTIFDADGNVKDYEKSFPLLLAHAKERDPIAQSLVGYCYLKGLGVRKNRLEARRWLRDAASQGDVDAMSNLGLMLEIGDGSSTNRRQALHWYGKAAENGSSFAQVNLGLMYLSGRRANHTLGLHWLRKAARKHDARAMLNLGIAYLRGDGVAKSPKSAERYFKRAAELGDEDAKVYLSQHGR